MEVCNSLPSKEEALWQKKKCLTSLSWSHLLSKCWSALTCSWSAVQSWNSTLEWGLVGSKTQPKDKEMRTSQQTDLWLSFFYVTWLMQKWDLLGHSFHMRPTPSVEDFIYRCILENHQKKEKIQSWLIVTDEKTFIYRHTFAIIFSCLVNFRPVGAGRIFTFMAEVKIWWAVKIKGWVRELKRANGVLKAAFQRFASHLSGGSQEMFPLIQSQRKLFKVESVFTTVLVKKTK